MKREDRGKDRGQQDGQDWNSVLDQEDASIEEAWLNLCLFQEFRTFPMERLAGEESTVVRLKEHQCIFEQLGRLIRPQLLKSSFLVVLPDSQAMGSEKTVI